MSFKAGNIDFRFVIITVVAGLILFGYQIAGPVIFIWDEALYANQAAEMAVRKDPFYYGSDLYNSKPPLVLWMQYTLFRTFGISEFWARFPSLLFSCGTAYYVSRFIVLKTKNHIAALAGVFCLASSFYFNGHHVARTADPDAALAFFSTCFLFYLYWSLQKNQTGFLQLMPVFLSLLAGYFCKSSAVFLILPPALLLVIYMKKWRSLIANKAFYIWVFLSLFIVLSFYFLMNIRYPGFALKVWQSEYTRVVSDIMPWHREPFNYYFQLLWSKEPVLVVLTLFISILTFLKNGTDRYLPAAILSLFVFYLMFLSLPPTKIYWYMGPGVPLLSVCCGIGIHLLSTYKSISRWYFIPGILAITTFTYLTVTHIKQLKNQDPLEHPGLALRYIFENHPEIQHLEFVFQTEHEAHLHQLNFYQKMWASKGKFVKHSGLFANVSNTTQPATFFCLPAKNPDKIEGKKMEITEYGVLFF